MEIPSRMRRMLRFSGKLLFVFCLSLARSWGGQAAGDHATVISESVTVYSRMSTASEVVKTLKKGDAVTIDFSIAGGEGSWCSVVEPGQTERSGYVLCAYLKRKPAQPTAAPAAPPAEPPAAAASVSRDALIDQMLELSGVRQSLGQSRSQVLDQMRSYEKALSPEDYKRLIGIISDAFGPETFYRAVKENFRRNFDERRTLALVAAFRSPSSRKPVDLVLQDLGPEATEEMGAFVAQVRSNPPPPERLALIQRLDDVTGTSEMMIKMVIAMIQRMPGTFRQDRNSLEQQAGQLQQVFRSIVLTRSLFLARGMSDRELEESVRFWESDPARWFMTVMLDGVRNGAIRAAERADEQVRAIQKSRAR